MSGRYAFGVSSMQGWRQAMEAALLECLAAVGPAVAYRPTPVQDAHLALPDFDVERELAGATKEGPGACEQTGSR